MNSLDTSLHTYSLRWDRTEQIWKESSTPFVQMGREPVYFASEEWGISVYSEHLDFRIVVEDLTRAIAERLDTAISVIGYKLGTENLSTLLRMKKLLREVACGEPQPSLGER